jgi:hypothetical protein
LKTSEAWNPWLFLLLAVSAVTAARFAAAWYRLRRHAEPVPRLRSGQA